MRFVTFKKRGGKKCAGRSTGVQQEGLVIDLSVAAKDLPNDLKDIISLGEPGLEIVRDAVANAPQEAQLPVADVAFLAALPNPSKIICLGLNFVDHAKEAGHEIPDYPALFMRGPSSLIGAGEPMVRPRCSEKFDYEAELMIVVGKRCRHVTEEDALSVVFGYTAFNDGSIRDYQRKSAQWTAGKNFDGTGPVGPAIVTADELPPGADGLRIQSRLNGQVLQDGTTSDMIFKVPQTIAILSEIMTLEPGDLIAMGTPAGVGHARKPPLWMRAGDVIEIDIEGIGVLRNPVADEDAHAIENAAG